MLNKVSINTERVLMRILVSTGPNELPVNYKEVVCKIIVIEVEFIFPQYCDSFYWENFTMKLSLCIKNASNV